MKKKLQIQLFLFIILLSCLDSYSQDMMFYYFNNEVNTLTISNKNELELTASMLDEQLKFNYQIGYSPFKHVTIAGSYLHESTNGGVVPFKREKASYLLSVGAYYFFELNKQPPLTENSMTKRKRLGLKFNCGFSKSNLNHYSNSDITKFNKTNYDSYFYNLGLQYEYNWGKFVVSGILNTVRFREVNLEGTWILNSEGNNIIDFFDTNKREKVWSMNINNIMGKGSFKFLFGITFSINESFDGLKVAPKSESGIFYLGGLIDFHRLHVKSKNKKAKISGNQQEETY